MANYMYPSVVLPDIETVWTDKETYPYAWITNVVSTDYFTISTLTLATKAAVYDGKVCISIPASYQRYEVVLAVTEKGRTTLEELGVDVDAMLSSGWVLSDESSDDGDYGYLVNIYWEQHGVAWTSHDILNTDGSTHLAAFTPVPATDGNVCYKGVELPDINTVWTDKEKYPYAYVTYSSLDIVGLEGMCAELHLMAKMPVFNAADSEMEFNQNTLVHQFVFTDNSELAFEHGISAGSWCDGFTDEIISFEVIDTTFTMWTSHDILNTDGSTYLAAYTPIPVDAAVKEWSFCLKSWLTGFALGMAGKPLPLAPVRKESIAYLYNGV